MNDVAWQVGTYISGQPATLSSVASHFYSEDCNKYFCELLVIAFKTTRFHCPEYGFNIILFNGVVPNRRIIAASNEITKRQ
jgi:hypothetical protein